MSRRMKWILGIGIPVCGILLAAGALIVIYLKLHVIEPVRFRFDYTDTGYVAARASGRYSPVSVRERVGGTELTVEEIFADNKQIAIRYTVTGVDALLGEDSSAYTLAGRCRVEIDGAFYDYAENTRTGPILDNRFESTLLLDSTDYPSDFTFGETPRLALTVRGYPGQEEEIRLETPFRAYAAEIETIGESLKVNGKTLRLDSIGKGSATMTLYIGEAEDDALGALCLDVGEDRAVQAQLVDYRKREVRFPALKTGDIYAVRIHGQTLFEGIY